jgi:hypothetical protein
MNNTLNDVVSVLAQFYTECTGEVASPDLLRFMPFFCVDKVVYSSDLFFVVSKVGRRSPQEIAEHFIREAPKILSSALSAKNGYLHVDATVVGTDHECFRPRFESEELRLGVSLQGTSADGWDIVELASLGFSFAILRGLFGLHTRLIVGDLEWLVEPGVRFPIVEVLLAIARLSEKERSRATALDCRLLIALKGKEKASRNKRIVPVSEQSVETPSYLVSPLEWIPSYSGKEGDLLFSLACASSEGVFDPGVPSFCERGNLTWWMTSLLEKLAEKSLPSSSVKQRGVTEERFRTLVYLEALVQWALYRNDPFSALDCVRRLADELAKALFPRMPREDSSDDRERSGLLHELLAKYSVLRAPF